MTIEQQLSDAVTDFHDLIAEGRDTPDAIREASSANGLKEGVLELHLSRRMPLQEIVGEIRREADRKETYEVIYDAVLGYVSDTYKNLFKQPAARRQDKLDRLQTALGHPPSTQELAQADAAERRIRQEISVKFQREFARTLRQTEPQTNAEH